jgi:aldehyde:ferredoxin oxidoreductase
MAEYGYAGEILQVDLSSGKITRRPTADYSGSCLGGRGLAARLFWEMVPPNVGALEPENCFLAVTGPTTGFIGVAGSRWQVCGKSPNNDPEAFSYGNGGGRWGNALKAAGFDAVAVQGRASRPVYLLVREGRVDIRDASHLWGRSTYDAIDQLKSELGSDVSVLTTGPAGENQVVFATVTADEIASASGGLGGVMGSKNLKAIVTAGSKSPVAAQPERLQRLSDHIKTLRGSPSGRPSAWGIPGLTVNEECFGCGIGCSRQMYAGENNRKYKSFCQATSIYKQPSRDYHGGWNDAELRGIRLVDGYSLDTGVMAPLVLWVIACYKEGLINEHETGLPLAQAGSAEFIEILTRMIAFREGFGAILAQGFDKAAAAIGPRARELMFKFVSTRAREAKDYDPRLFITTALFYATEPRRPIQQLHGVSIPVMTWLNWARKMPNAFFNSQDIRKAARRYWGGEIAADFSTYQGKALAAKKIQDRVYAKESLILCDLMWPMMSINTPDEHVGDPTLENQILSAIIGKETDEAGLAKIGERVFNLERAIQLRLGWRGRQDDTVLDYFHDQPLQPGEVFFDPEAIVPGPEGEIISRTGCVLDRQKFEEMKTEYYRLRGWAVATGYPTTAKLNELGLADVASDLEQRGLVG